MADLLYIAIIIAFFALMVVFVHVCERVVGTEDEPDTQTGSDGIAPTAATREEVPA